MAFYPVYLRLDGKLCVVIGGGNVAYRKVLSLLECGGRVRLVSDSVIPGLEKLVHEQKLEYHSREFSDGDLSGAFMVIGATDNPKVNALVYKIASSKGLLVNIIDSPDECNFIVPSVVRSGDLCISVSTGGKSPALAKKTRKKLQDEFGDEYGVFLAMMGEMRPKVIENNQNLAKRMELFSDVVESDIMELIKSGEVEEARMKMQKMLGLYP